MAKISLDDRDVHLKAVIKSNLVNCGIEMNSIQAIVDNIFADILDVLNVMDEKSFDECQTNN